MAADASVNARLQAGGVGLVTMKEGVAAFSASLTPRGPAVLGTTVLKWSKFLSTMPEVPPLMSAFASHKKATGAAVAASTEKKAVGMDFIVEAVRQTTGGKVDPDAPLMEAGLDSLGAVELGNQLQAQSGMTLPSTLIFDYPTARQLAGFFEASAAPAETKAAPAATASGDGPTQDDVVERGPLERDERHLRPRGPSRLTGCAGWPRAPPAAPPRCRSTGGCSMRA